MDSASLASRIWRLTKSRRTAHRNASASVATTAGSPMSWCSFGDAQGGVTHAARRGRGQEAWRAPKTKQTNPSSEPRVVPNEAASRYRDRQTTQHRDKGGTRSGARSEGEIREKASAAGAPSIASSEGNWRGLHSALVFPPPSQAGRRGFESHRPLF